MRDIFGEMKSAKKVSHLYWILSTTNVKSSLLMHEKQLKRPFEDKQNPSEEVFINKKMMTVWNRTGPDIENSVFIS